MTREYEHKYYLGKCDYLTKGVRNCKAYLTWTFDDVRFSMCGEIWQPDMKDCLAGGQCVDTVVAYFPNDVRAQRMLAIWQEWHLNDMTAGSPRQMAYLRENKQFYVRSMGDYYTWATKVLTLAGLNPDVEYLHNGQPYAYGHAWLTRNLPDDVRAEILSWSPQASSEELGGKSDPVFSPDSL